MFDKLTQRSFQFHFVSHAAAILKNDFPTALDDIETALADLTVPIAELIGSGGGESKGTQRLRHKLSDLEWKKHIFDIRKIINGVEREAVSHEVDHVKSYDGDMIALEIEWNNKDPFFDRDLDNFKRLHAEGAISVGVVITRGTTLQERMKEFVLRFAKENKVMSFEDLERLDIQLTKRKRAEIESRTKRAKAPVSFAEAWTDNFVSDKYGESTTHWRKLMDRVNRGVGNPCPLLLIGLPAEIVSFPRKTGKN
ncbi:MAG: BglII/BstYI family type II restriction endonuclease [Acidobacteriota bacterium]|nr:BglII/BstYI family type II restriction endonuclease [Acidobacteriota bacterium]